MYTTPQETFCYTFCIQSNTKVFEFVFTIIIASMSFSFTIQCDIFMRYFFVKRHNKNSSFRLVCFLHARFICNNHIIIVCSTRLRVFVRFAIFYKRNYEINLQFSVVSINLIYCFNSLLFVRLIAVFFFRETVAQKIIAHSNKIYQRNRFTLMDFNELLSLSRNLILRKIQVRKICGRCDCQKKNK